MVTILDVLDTSAGLWTVGGSLGELVLCLVAFEEFVHKEKLDVEVSREFVTSWLKSLLPVIKSRITAPRLLRKAVIEQMNSENPTGVLLDALEKEDDEE